MAKHSFSTILYRPSLLTSTFSPGGNCLSLAPLLYSRCTLLGPEQILTWQLTHCVEFWSQDHDILNSVLTGTTYLLPVFLQVEQVVVSCQTAAWREKILWPSCTANNRESSYLSHLRLWLNSQIMIFYVLFKLDAWPIKLGHYPVHCFIATHSEQSEKNYFLMVFGTTGGFIVWGMCESGFVSSPRAAVQYLNISCCCSSELWLFWKSGNF